VEEIPSTEVASSIGSVGAMVSDPHQAQQQDQLVYIGQPGDEFQAEQQQQAPQFLNTDQIIQNGGVDNSQQYVTLDQQQQPHVVVSSNGQQNIVGGYNGISTTEASMPSMSDVAEQVLQAANIIDSGYRDSNSTGMMLQQPTNVNGVSLHTTSLNNGVVLSYEEPKLNNTVVSSNQYQMQPITVSNNNNMMQHHSVNNRSNFNKNKGRFNNKMNSTSSHESISANGFGRAMSGRSSNRSLIPIKKKPVKVSHTVTDEIIRIKIDTGHDMTDKRLICLDDNVIRIKTTTGQIKPRTPKFFRCTSCTIHFVTEQSLLQHIKNGCVGSKKKTSYECTYCLAKFSSKAKTMEHLRICTKRSQMMNNKKNQNLLNSQNKLNRSKVSSNSTQAVEVEITSDDETSIIRQEKKIVYDDDDDIDIDLAGDNEDFETGLGKVSQKHLGPILTGGKFQCRDCDRTFSKDSQYKRHEGVCTNAPLTASRIDTSMNQSSGKLIPEPKKKGRPRKNTATAHPYKPKQLDTKKKPVINLDDSVTEWDFLSSPNSKKSQDAKGVNSANIMNMLETNLESNIMDGGRELSESFLQCLDGNDTETTKAPTPSKNKPTVCGLCIRHMASNDALSEHITAMHGKDIVNMHAILTNNTDLKTHKCTFCSLHFISSEAVNSHIAVRHHDRLQDKLKTLRASSMEIPCPWCTDKLMSTELFQQHLAVEHTKHFPEAALTPVFKPEELDSKSLQAAQITHFPSYGESIFTGKLCMNCGEAFNKLKDLETHSKICNEETLSYDNKAAQHLCHFTNCNGELYNSLSDLIAHIQEVIIDDLD